MAVSPAQGMNKKLEQGQSTRQRIIDEAITLFARDGYEATSISGLLNQTGLSRGALYHHFDSKEALFDAVLDQVESSLATRILAAANQSRDPMASLEAGCLNFLRLSRDPVIRQIVLIDAPTAVGWRRWREIDEKYGFGLMKFSLSTAGAHGKVDEGLVEMYAHMILASLMELALLVARSEQPDTDLAKAEQAITVLIGALRKEVT